MAWYEIIALAVGGWVIGLLAVVAILFAAAHVFDRRAHSANN